MPTINRSFAAPLAVLLILALFSAGCSSSNVVTTLDAAVAAAEVAVTIIETTGGITQAQAVTIETYLQAVGSASSIASTELATNDSATRKAQVIIAAFDKAVISTNALNQLPPAISGAIQAVIAAVQSFLQTISPAVKTAKLGAVKLNAQEAARLSGIHTRGYMLSRHTLHTK